LVPVSPDPPSQAWIATGVNCAGWNVGRAILFGVEAREVLSDDLVLAVALQALCSRIPARNTSFWIQHKDGVVQ